MGGIYGCGYKVFNVVSRFCCKEVYRFPHNNNNIILLFILTYTPLVLAHSLQQHPYFFVCFSFLFMLFLYNIANVAQRTLDRSKIEIT